MYALNFFTLLNEGRMKIWDAREHRFGFIKMDFSGTA